MAELKKGTILKVSEAGLKAFYPNPDKDIRHRKHMRKARFEFIIADSVDETLKVRRLDTKSHLYERWHKDYLSLEEEN